MILYSFLLILLAHTLSAKSVSVKDSCDESKTSFFVIDNASLKTEDFIVYKETSEEECLKTCTQNRDQFDRPITCNSFTYDHASFSCSIYKEKAVPVGSGQIETVAGRRYFEKMCLNNDLPSQCGQSQFIRVDQSVLVGYAVNMTLTDSVEACVAQCVQESDCKSAMYFYQDGECITNKESALTKPAGFTKEEEDRVIYFQNGCNGNTKSSVSKTEQAESPAPKTEVVDETFEDEVRPEVNIQISETTPKPDSKNSQEQEKVNEEMQAQPEEEYEEETDEVSEEAEEEPTTTPTTTTTTEASEEAESKKRVKSLLQKKIKKHPKNFGSKTYEILKKQETVKQSKQTEEEEEETSKEMTRSEEAVETYFSEWSDWTPCTKSQERQVRRRRCLNLRKCLGALMQVQNCPLIVPTSTPQNIASVRSVVSVDGEEYDDPIAVDNISVDPVPSRTVPLLNEQMWGPWQGTCQQFASSQPCNNGSMIGFESRECIAKDPSQCEGPFFRYCTLSC